MNRLARLLAGGLSALACATTHAVERDDAGFGQVLIFPYLSATGQFDTLVSLSNRRMDPDAGSRRTAAVRVALHFVGAEALPPQYFDVYMPFNATWAFAIRRDDAGVWLSTSGPDCVIDAEGNALNGEPYRLPDAAREGWIEVYELGSIQDVELASMIMTHVNAPHNRPPLCEQAAALVPTLEDWLGAPANRLRGVSHLVDGPSGTSFTLAPAVLRDFRDSAFYPTPGQAGPTLADALPPQAVIRNADGTRRVSSFAAAPIDAVSAVLMDTRWDHDFTVEPDIAAETDLIVLSPTRAWYVDGEASRAPFAHHATHAVDGKVRTTGQLSGRIVAPFEWSKCTPVPPRPQQFGPVIDDSLVVARFAASSLLGSDRAQSIEYAEYLSMICYARQIPVWERLLAGSFSLDFDSLTDHGIGRLVSDEGHVFHGLPVVGAAIARAVNGNVGGALANYGITQPLTRSRDHPSD
jgi:hypothetical protein